MTTGDLRMRALMLNVSQAYTALLTLAALAPVQLAAALDQLEEPAGTARCCAEWGDGKRCQHCTQPAGHDGNHIDGIGHAWGNVTPAGAVA